jgi:hypothetical protein
MVSPQYLLDDPGEVAESDLFDLLFIVSHPMELVKDIARVPDRLEAFHVIGGDTIGEVVADVEPDTNMVDSE